MMRRRNTAKLIFDSSEKNTDLFYWSRISVSDPFFAFEINEQKVALINALEFKRLQASSKFHKVYLIDDVKAILKQFNPSKPVTLVQCLNFLRQEYAVDQFLLPKDFPLGMALTLKREKIKFKVETGIFLPERKIKSDEEILQLKKVANICSEALELVYQLLKKTEIRDKELWIKNRPLTSERVRELIQKFFLENECSCDQLIVSCGQQAIDVHEPGHGVLRANEFIVVDLFPRHQKTGYHSDMSRTFLRGRASETQKKLYKAVEGAQKLAFKTTKVGIQSSEIHETVVYYFEQEGYNTRRTGNGCEGFIHSTGHGIGLAVHEAPYIGSPGEVLQEGMAFTLEPGLYYADMGGVRIEDVVVLEGGKAKMLSPCCVDWEIR